MNANDVEVSVIDPKTLDDLERLASAAKLDAGVLSGVNVIGGNPRHLRAFVSATTPDAVLTLIAEARALAAIRRFLTMAAKAADELHPDDPEIPGAIAGLDRTDDALIGAYAKAWRDLVEEKASEVARLRAEREGAAQHTISLEQQNVALLRWQSTASDAHVDHLCALVRSLAVSDETPRELRDLSACGVEEEIRRVVCAERINRAKSEASATEARKTAESMEGRALDAEMDAARLRERVAELECGIDAIIDRKRIHDDAPEILHTLQRHYEMVCKVAGDANDTIEDIGKVVGVDALDSDDVLGEIRAVFQRVASLANQERNAEQPIQGEPFMPGYKEPR